mmetsp:Transcript_81748/g.227655  ORF Transcript_81748/g.227655 Transcript_81748/m.227655 type:complete len:256 (-) Transcript_81748:344-1111(-)
MLCGPFTHERGASQEVGAALVCAAGAQHAQLLGVVEAVQTGRRHPVRVWAAREVGVVGLRARHRAVAGLEQLVRHVEHPLLHLLRQLRGGVGRGGVDGVADGDAHVGARHLHPAQRPSALRAHHDRGDSRAPQLSANAEEPWLEVLHDSAGTPGALREDDDVVACVQFIPSLVEHGDDLGLVASLNGQVAGENEQPPEERNLLEGALVDELALPAMPRQGPSAEPWIGAGAMVHEDDAALAAGRRSRLLAQQPHL